MTRSWTLPITVDYGIGSGKGNPTNDGRFVALGNRSAMFIVDMDPQPPYEPYPNVRIGPVYAFPPESLTTAAPDTFTIDHLSISPSGKFLYVSNSVSSTLSAYSVDSSGGLTAIAGQPFAVGASPNGITIDPSGKFLYVASLNAGNFSGFAIDSSSGALRPMSGSPYAVVISPTVTPLSAVAMDLSGKFLYVTALNSNKIYAYTINATTGVPSQISNSPFATGGGPAFIATDAAGQFLFVGNQSSSNVSVFRITHANGVLTSIATASTSSAPTSMVVVK